MATELEALRAAPIFRTTDPKLLQLLALLSSRETFRAGEHLCRLGDRGDAAFVILEGEASVQIRGADGGGPGKEVAVLGRHEIVGEIAVICDIPRTADVIARGEVEALRIPKQQLLQMMADAPGMALEMMRALALRLNETTQALYSR